MRVRGDTVSDKHLNALIWIVRILAALACLVFVPYTVLKAFATSPNYVSECLHLAGLPRWFTVIPVISVFLLALRTVYGLIAFGREWFVYMMFTMMLVIYQFAPAITRKDPSDVRSVMGLAVPVLAIIYTVLIWRFKESDQAMPMGEREMLESTAAEKGIVFVDLDRHELDPAVLAVLSRETIRKHSILPVRLDKNTLYIAMKDVNDVAAQDAARSESGMRIIPILAMPDKIDEAIRELD